MDSFRYSYFLAFSYHACPEGVVKLKNGRREARLKAGLTSVHKLGERYEIIEGRSNLSMLFESPINSYQQILDAQEIILQQSEFYLDVSIQFYQFLCEEPTEGNHESGPEQEEASSRWDRPPVGTSKEGRVGGRYGKAAP